ncbi:MAG: hotdog fold thioesterase [Melioribacteraceae bacterium]|nr:hotdog fold thioesterase [Melioribacteraceae bacterium]MCF8263032.1 hotdog fold thioesterase [Melioribacteraceae bacterium]MCF8414116.1 hotdog fold thioesterase [Melioribacteraceae bacterium]MCF8430477.1 hotdog fold thioesterase [Melioribacteraceae bacterium]
MNEQLKAEKIINKMLENDRFTKWLGIEILEIKPGYSKLKMKIRNEMMNGFGTCHGGVTFSLADSALAFASNNYGRISVALETGIAFPAPVYENDELFAEAIEESKGNSVGIYSVIVKNGAGTKVGVFRGTVYRTKKEFSI